jgi:uncharacterized protein involved in exopolysaccharide biosynthesis
MSDQAAKAEVFPHGRIRPARSVRRHLAAAWQVAAVTAIVLAGSLAAYPFLPRRYESTSALQIRPTNTEGAATWDQSGAVALDDNAIQTKIDILRSEPLQAHLIEQFNLMSDPEFNPALRKSAWRQALERLPFLSSYLPPARNDEGQVLATLLQRLVVRRERKSYIIQVGYWSLDPLKAAWLTNALAASFVQDQLASRRNSDQELLSRLQARIDGLDARYRADEKIEGDFIVAAGLVNIGEQEALQTQLQILSTAVADAYRQTAERRNRAAMLANQRDLDSTSEALNSPLLQHLRERYVLLRSGAGSATGTGGATNLTIDLLRQGIATETQRLVSAAQSDAAVAQQTEASLRAEISRIDAALADLANKKRRREDLHRAVQTDLDALGAANQQYIREAGRADALQADIVVAAPGSVPDRPVFPSPLLYGSGVAGLLVLLNGLVLLPAIMRRAQARGAIRVL